MTQTVAQKTEQFFTAYPLRKYPKGQILVFADESPDHIFYIVEGKVRKYDVSYRGDEVIVNVFSPPAFFPMSWAINKTKNKYFYKTETNSALHIIPTDDALKFIKSNPDVMLDLLSRLYKGMDGLMGRVVHLMSGTARSRLLYELIIECRRFGEEQKDGSYKLSVTEVDIAARSGLSRETVNREIHKVKDLGIVQIEQGGMIVKDIHTLEKLLGTEI